MSDQPPTQPSATEPDATGATASQSTDPAAKSDTASPSAETASPPAEPAPPPADLAPPPTPPLPPESDTLASDGGSAAVLEERPEVAVGAAFAGGLVLALILKRLAR